MKCRGSIRRSFLLIHLTTKQTCFYLRAFGCKVWCYILEQKRNNLLKRGWTFCVITWCGCDEKASCPLMAVSLSLLSSYLSSSTTHTVSNALFLDLPCAPSACLFLVRKWDVVTWSFLLVSYHEHPSVRLFYLHVPTNVSLPNLVILLCVLCTKRIKISLGWPCLSDGMIRLQNPLVIVATMCLHRSN